MKSGHGRHQSGYIQVAKKELVLPQLKNNQISAQKLESEENVYQLRNFSNMDPNLAKKFEADRRGRSQKLQESRFSNSHSHAQLPSLRNQRENKKLVKEFGLKQNKLNMNNSMEPRQMPQSTNRNDSIHSLDQSKAELFNSKFTTKRQIQNQSQPHGPIRGEQPTYLATQQSDLNDPFQILRHHNDCKNENIERLKKVEKLEDLVNFKMSTIADKLKREQDVSGGRQLDSLLGEDSLAQPASTLETSKQVHSQPLVYQESSQAISVLSKMCDPLLANQVLQTKQYPKLMLSNKAKIPLKNQAPNQTSVDKYEIPDELKQLPKNYNQYIPLKDIMPKPGAALEKKNVERNFDQFDVGLSPPRMELDLNIKQKQEPEQQVADVIDPQVMLKQYFNKMDNHKTVHQKRYGKEISNHLSSKAHNKSLFSENYLVSKYEKKKHNGELQKLEEQIQKREQRERLMMKSPNEFEADDDLYDDSKLNTAKFQTDPDFENVVYSQSQNQTDDTGSQPNEQIPEYNATFNEGFQQEDKDQQDNAFVETLHSQQQFANEVLKESQSNQEGLSIFDQLVDQNVPDIASIKTKNVQHNLKISQIKNLQSYKNYSQNRAGIHEYIPLSKKQIEIAQTFQKGKERDARKQRSPRISKTDVNMSPRTPKRKKDALLQDEMLQYKMRDLKVIQKQKFKHLPNKEPAPKEEFFPKKSKAGGLQPVVGSHIKIEEPNNQSKNGQGGEKVSSRLTSAEEAQKSTVAQEPLMVQPVHQIQSKVAHVKQEMLINPYQNNQLTAQQTQKLSQSGGSPREEIQTAEIYPTQHPTQVHSGPDSRKIDHAQQMSKCLDQSFDSVEQLISSPGRSHKQQSKPELVQVEEHSFREEQPSPLKEKEIETKQVIDLTADAKILPSKKEKDSETIKLHESEHGDAKTKSQIKFNLNQPSNRGSVQNEVTSKPVSIPKARNQAMTQQTTDSQLNRVSQHNIQLGFDGLPEQLDQNYERNSTVLIDESTHDEKGLLKNSSAESLTNIVNHQTPLDINSHPKNTSSLKGKKISNQAFPQTHNTSINLSSQIQIEQVAPEDIQRHSTENLKVGADIVEDIERMKLDGIINMHLVKRAQWVPQRYTKNPRHYARSSPRNVQAVREATYDESMQYISLNPQIIALLTSSDINQANVFPMYQFSQSRQNIQVVNQGEAAKKTFMDLGNVEDRKETTGRLGAVTEALGSLHENSLTQVIEDSPDSMKRNTGTLLRNTNTIQQQDTIHDVPEGGATADSILQSQDDSLNQTGRQYFERGPDAINTGGNSSLERIVEVRTNATPPVEVNTDYEHFEDLDVQQVFDPFQKVLITKQNQIDNQILTSFRTLTKQNNIISNTLKVLHKRFQPIKKNHRLTKLKALYEIKHYDDVKQEITVQNVQDGDMNTIPIDDLDPVGHENGFMEQTGQSFRLPLGEAGDITQDSFASTHAGLNLNINRDVVLNPADEGQTLRSRSASDQQNKRSHRNLLQVKKVEALEAQQVKVPTTTAKQTQIDKLQKAPMAIYDVTAGQAMEEEGYGYWRSKYVMDPYFPTKKKVAGRLLNQHQSEQQLLTERTLLKNNSDTNDLRIGPQVRAADGTLERNTKQPTGVTASRQYLLVFSDGKPVNTGSITNIQQVPTSQQQTPLLKAKRKSIPIPQKKDTAGLRSDMDINSSSRDLRVSQIQSQNEVDQQTTQRIPEIMLRQIPKENAYADEEDTKNLTKSSHRRLQGNSLKKFNSSQTSNIPTPVRQSKESHMKASKEVDKINQSQIFENDSSINAKSNKTSTQFKQKTIAQTLDVNGSIVQKDPKLIVREVDLEKVQASRKKTINLQNKDDVTVLGQTSKGDTDQLTQQNDLHHLENREINMEKTLTNPGTITGNSYYQFDLLKSASNRHQKHNPISVLVQQQTTKQQSTKNQLSKPSFPGGFKNNTGTEQNTIRETIIKKGDVKDTSMQATRRVTSQNSTERVANATQKQIEMKAQIKNLIDSTFKNDLKYTRKQVAREDLVLASDPIFDLGKLQYQNNVGAILNGGPTENPDDQDKSDQKVVLRGQAMKK